jgi:RNA polymerase sigma factor (sigma-70 family)
METTPNKPDDLDKLAEETQARISERGVVEKFFKKVYPHVERASARTMARFPSKQCSDVGQDLTQIACKKIWTSLLKFDPKRARFKTWINVIVRGVWFDVLEAAREGDYEEIDVEDARELAAPMSAVDDQVDARRRVEILHVALPRPTLELVIGDGLGCTLKELAFMQGANLDTTKSRLIVARQRAGEVLSWASVGCIVAA